jgi:FMN reductase
LIVGVGGSVDPDSQSERAMRSVLAAARRRGARTVSFTGRALDFAPYHSGAVLPETARDYIEAVRSADAIVISSPGYHGTVSGLVKNALDYLEELRTDTRPYLDGRPVGAIAVARGWQAAAGTLSTLRQIIHALRGWPTPLGLTINSAVTTFDAADVADDSAVSASADLLAGQLVDFVRRSGRG